MKRVLIMLMFASLVFQFSSCVEDGDIFPDDDPRTAFLGAWTVDESCVRLNYEVVISAASGDDTKVLMDNFALTGPGYPPAYGFVSGKVIEVPQQTIGDDWKVEGSGTLQSNGKILWSYYIEIAGDGSNCEAEYEQ